MPSSVRMLHIHHISVEALATDLYSASIEERATPVFFLADQEIGVFPKYTT